MENKLRIILMIIFLLVVVGAVIGLDAKIFVLKETIRTQQKHISMLQSSRNYVIKRIEKLQVSVKKSAAMIDQLSVKNSSLETKSKDLEGKVKKLRDDIVAISKIDPQSLPE